MKTALVTGHRGFIGRHMAAKLAELGYATQGVDIADPAMPIDARDFFRVDDQHFDLVVHCAAVVGGRAKIDGAPLEVAANLSIDAEMFSWALRTKPGRIVYFSSSAVYPIFLQDGTWVTPLSEDVVDNSRMTVGLPDQTYGWAKLTGEKLAQYAIAEGIPVHVFRPFSGYGEDQDLDYPFPAFVDRALKRCDPFEVWGDGAQVRDWIHVDDIVGAVFAAIDQDVRGPVNVCTGVGTSFNALADLATRAAGYSPEVKHLFDAPTGVRHRVGDPTEMLKFYTPRISVEDGIKRAIRALS